MYKIEWDLETGGVRLNSRYTENTLGISPRPVFWEELELLKLSDFGWKFPQVEEPLLWACNKKYYYKGEQVFEVKGANVYDAATVILTEGKENLVVEPVNVQLMLEKCKNEMFLLESEAIEFIHETYTQYSLARKIKAKIISNIINPKSIYFFIFSLLI